MKCLQCNSEDIVRNVRAIDHTKNNKTDLSLEGYEDRKAIFFKGTFRVPLTANVCVDCGFVMWSISTNSAATLKELDRKNR